MQNTLSSISSPTPSFKTKYLSKLIIAAALALSVSGCFGPKGGNLSEKQDSVRELRDETLAQLYKEIPGSEQLIADSAGYAVFSNLKAKILWAGAGAGHGIAVDNATGKETFMRMGELQAGLGFGISDFRAVFIFQHEDVYKDFIMLGLDFSVSADATAKSENKGGSSSLDTNTAMADPLIYKFTDSGIALSATINGTSYWRSPSLN